MILAPAHWPCAFMAHIETISGLFTKISVNATETGTINNNK